MADLDALARKYGGTIDELATKYGGTITEPIPTEPIPTETGLLSQFVNELPTNLSTIGRGVVAGAAAPINLFADPLVALENLFLPANRQAPLPSNLIQELLTKLGVPEAKTATQKIVQAATTGLTGAGTTAAAADVVKNMPGLVGATGEVLASQPGVQMASGALSGAASESAALLGAPPIVQVGAGLAGGLIGSKLANTTVVPPKVGPIQDAERVGVRLMTSDVYPPQGPMGKWIQTVSEIIGTGAIRNKQQNERVNAVKDLVRQYGADDLNTVSDAVMQDLIDTRKTNLTKWTTSKNDVIDKLSWPINKPINKPNYPLLDAPPPSTDPTLLGPPGPLSLPDLKSGPPGPLSLPDPKSGPPVFQEPVPGPRAPEPMPIFGGPLVPSANKPPVTKPKGAGAVGIARKPLVKTYDMPTNEEGVSRVVPMTNTLQRIDDSITYLNQLKTDKVLPVIKVLEDWKQAIQGQDLRNIETLRKQIGDVFAAPELGTVRSTSERILTDIYPAVNEDMGNYIKINGGTTDFNKWKVANKELSNMMGELDLSSLKRVLNKGDITPEEVKSLLFSQKKSTVQALYRNLSPDGQANMRSAIISKAAIDKMGIEVLPDQFITNIKKLSDQVGVTFSGTELKELDGLTRVLEYTTRAGKGQATPPAGIKGALMLPVSAAALASLFGGGIKGFAGALTAGVAVGGTARLYESKIVRNLLSMLPTVKPGSPEEVALLKRLITAAEVVNQTESKPKAPTGSPSLVQVYRPN